MGWLWLIPSLHVLPPADSEKSERITKLVLTRDEIDFPVGVGTAIVDVEISFEWLKESEVAGQSLGG
jgi:phosphatidylinositol-3,4,5-trisphosphate 3-phosphatase and dual-specificity protein phosphatase PTEN